MKKQIPIKQAKAIETELNKNKIDFEIGYDTEGAIHILCGIDDENTISEIVDKMNLPYKQFMWFGSFASDAIIEDFVA